MHRTRATGLTEQMTVLGEQHTRVAGEVDALEERVRRHEARSELLRARRADLEETPGSRFIGSGGTRAIGLLRDLVRVEPPLRRALATALGPFADAVVFEREQEAVDAASAGGGAWLAVAQGGPVSFVLPGERSLLSKVSAEPPARGLISTVLRDIYLADEKSRTRINAEKRPHVGFVTNHKKQVVNVIICDVTSRGGVESKVAELPLDRVDATIIKEKFVALFKRLVAG